ncbi:esterase family protein [Saccharopolyspora hirsuta]|uniref:Esterase family protein n=2 Tax=Saccharopolyspora hirsuta TaxID=1837 RepID=A0A5M7CE96_SACHI|nr:esterase family protein [Saccharopolyspora hirsuta]
MRRAAIAVPVLLALVTVAAGVNSYVGYVRSLDDLGRLLLLASGGNQDSEPATPIPPAVPGGVRVADVSLPDPGLGIPTGRTRVLLPPGYDDPAHADERYPVVYLVHGYPSGGPDDWLGPGGAVQTLQALADTRTTPPMIVVAVDATAGTGTDWECLDVPGGPQLETYLTTTVPREVDARFRTLPDRGDRAIGGMSGGAFCALNLGLRNQGTYSVVLASEPSDDPGTDLLAGHPDLLRANTPREYLPTLQIPQPLAVMLHAGVVAHSDVDLAYRLADQLAARGADVAVRTEPGEWHTWRTARIGLPYLLTFAAEHFTDRPPAEH